jgi:hypothetical protein
MVLRNGSPFGTAFSLKKFMSFSSSPTTATTIQVVVTYDSNSATFDSTTITLDRTE